MLTAAQLKAREGKLTASRIGVLMGGDPVAVHDLWRELTGDPSYAPEDLSDVWAVQLGSFTESLHLEWYARRTSHAVTRAGEVVTHPSHSWAACTLDGWDDALGCPVECKHVNNFSKFADVRDRYMPQLTWQMLCAGADKIILSVIIGANEPQHEEIPFDVAYAAELMGRAIQFMRCVETMTPPCDLPAVAAPVPHDQMITIDMTGNNAFAMHAGAWIETRDHAKRFDTASKELKALVEANVGLAYGHGVKISRSKAGSLTIKGDGK